MYSTYKTRSDFAHSTMDRAETALTTETTTSTTAHSANSVTVGLGAVRFAEGPVTYSDASDYTELRGDDSVVALFNGDAMVHNAIHEHHLDTQINHIREMANKILEYSSMTPEALRLLGNMPEQEYNNYLVVLRFPNEVAWRLLK